MLFFMRDKAVNGKAVFSKGELSLILGIYGDRVKRGEWRDYAIDSLPDMAVFSVYKSAKEEPVYAIAKISSRSVLKPPRYAVYSGDETLKESTKLADIVNFFTEMA
jgi:hypothetical protein